jgi:hypothetical protein
MSENLRTSFPRSLTPLAAGLALLGSVNLVAAQSAPPPPPRQIIAAPPPAPAPAAAPAPVQAAPAPAPAVGQGVPGAYAQPPAATYPQQPQQGYADPAAQPGAYPQQQQGYPPPASYQQPPPGYVAYPNSQPLYQPSGPVPFRPRRASKGMMIAGISILGGSYLLAMGVGVGLLDEDDDDFDECEHCADVAPWLFVPVVGPFVAMSKTSDGDWGLWMLGMIELVGAGLMTGGIIKYRHSKRAADMQGYSWNLDNGRKLTVDMASSTRFAGPRLRLDF